MGSVGVWLVGSGPRRYTVVYNLLPLKGHFSYDIFPDTVKLIVAYVIGIQP
jgi:hypothetical protein